MSRKKLTYEFVKDQFEKEGYELLSSEYIGSRSKLNYICSKGHKHSINWADWSQGKRCPYCSGNDKPTIEFIKMEFEKEGYTILDSVYKDNKQKLTYICAYGHKHSISWSSWKYSQRCPYCAGNGKPTIDFIKSKLEDEGYVLLSKVYKNAHQKLSYICKEGHMHSITWSNWSQGYRCPTCANYLLSIDRLGVNNPNWKGGISNAPYCSEWTNEYKDEIKERDGYKCLNPYCFGKDERLHIHHIDYTKTLCGPDNLITVCGSCNSRANKDREWHIEWYRKILNKRYNYKYNSRVV